MVLLQRCFTTRSVSVFINVLLGERCHCWCWRQATHNCIPLTPLLRSACPKQSFSVRRFCPDTDLDEKPRCCHIVFCSVPCVCFNFSTLISVHAVISPVGGWNLGKGGERRIGQGGYEGGWEGGGFGVFSAPAPEAVLGLSNRVAFAPLCCGVELPTTFKTHTRSRRGWEVEEEEYVECSDTYWKGGLRCLVGVKITMSYAKLLFLKQKSFLFQ